jgi:hypothetical protein
MHQAGQNFAFIDSQADIIYGMLAVKGFGEVADFKKRGQRFTDFRLRAGVASFTGCSPA